MLKPKVVAILGPTASGKTGLGIRLAQHFAGEVISADSRQVYRGLDIGTAKVTAEEMQGIPHHLIDIVNIDTIYTASDFQRDADTAIADIKQRDKLPIVVGGTNFYVEVLRRTMQPAPVPPNYTLRNQLEQLSSEVLYTKLKQLDPRRAATIDPLNRRRLIRALEIADALGAVPPQLSSQLCPYQMLLLGINRQKEELLDQFAARAINWLQNGLVEEVQGLLDIGVTRERLQEIGFEYTLVLSYLDGELDDESFVTAFVQKNWQYAKRQLTWLKRDEQIHWVDPTDTEQVFSLVSIFLEQK